MGVNFRLLISETEHINSMLRYMHYLKLQRIMRINVLLNLKVKMKEKLLILKMKKTNK